MNKQGESGRVEVLSWLSKMTLDVIGQAGKLERLNEIFNCDLYDE